jgi:hypothetical protein
MDTVKEVLSLIITVVGLISAIIPLYARYVDKKQKAGKEAPHAHRHRRMARQRVAVASTALAEPEAEAGYHHEPPAEPEPFHPAYVRRADEVLEVLPAPADAGQVERIRQLVKAPAIALMATGFLGLTFNLLVAAYGFVDTFITPLSTESQNRSGATAPAGYPDSGRNAPAEGRQRDADQSPATKVLTIVTVLSLSLACGMAVWAGFNMINLRSYRLSLAGCLAIMPGAIFCCAAGMPVGIWSLTVLLKPEVRSAFT